MRSEPPDPSVEHPIGCTRPHAAFSVAQYPLRNAAILDTGTTIDVFNEITRFINFHTASVGDFLWAGTQKVAIQGYGDVDIAIDSPMGKEILRLHDVAFCEDFACSIVSFRKLQRRGYWWDTRPGQNCLRRSADHSILAYLKDLYDQFVLEDLPEGIPRSAFFARRNKFNSYTKRRPSRAVADTWHLRLGHPGPQALRHLVNSSQGVRIRGPTTTQCDGCATAKIKRKIRRAPRNDRGSLVPGQRLAIDFHDFEEGRGFKSAMLVTDRCSGFIWDFYFDKRTAKAIITALSYLFDLLQSQGFKIEVIECDNPAPAG